MLRQFYWRYLWATIMFGLTIEITQAEELRILCWEGYAASEYTQKFEQLVKAKYGMDLRVTVTGVSDPQEFFTLVRQRKTDLISPAHNIPKSPRWQFIKGQFVLPIDLENIPNYKHIIQELQQADYITEQGQVYGVPIVYGPYGLMYNTALIKTPPQSWNIFWDPQYAGQYAISKDYHEANIYFSGLALGLEREQIFNYNTLRNNADFMPRLEQLAQNAKSFWVGVDSADTLQGLAFATGWGFAIPELAQRGETWKMAWPKEGTTGWVDNWMIGYSLKDKPKLKRIAEEWINFSISPEIQTGYVRNIAQFPVNQSTKNLLTAKEIKQFHLDEPDYFKKNLILWKVLPRREQNGFKRMWSQARHGKQ
ncbi:ABC transporter substrate-binding protein [Candidatus Venteria ishoeyi]|uniref:Spermidine/putrescine ABC transporter periplasmic substrate-binding protein n=1 Tax=Candidatus Venteria ishoeyi TaxID=1899563 RepID=A0A1H6FBL8_9GAMM|nr:extracellular solute-binding protein [Candidatus Venteria ishoeyi]MDM8547206.1 extracellular solute-binding protein [Candidatus Venteria ishoeyi]SEH06526.1 spermidine/putrescine ABC transporter periplasmic substrate-binding protein [Candidatus Venteria ishoeyi]